MQACTPASANFVSLETAPEVSGAIPIGAGMHRLWDLGVTWKDLNPASGIFVWTALDAQVNKVEASGAKPLLVLGMTPQWAAANPNAGDPRWGAGTASPPRDINDWRSYVTAVVDRYGSRIAAYELWNEANLLTFWTGTPEEMADLTAAAYPIIKAKQPTAIVLLPSVTLRLRASMRKFVGPFLGALSTRGYPFDGFAIHSYPAGNLGPQDRVNDIVYWQSTVVNQVGADSPVLSRLTFDTEVNYGVAGPGTTPGHAYSDAEGASLIKQTFLDSASLGIDATFWYLYTAAPYGLLGVQLWSGASLSIDAWAASRRVFSTGSPCPSAGQPSPFDTDIKLALVSANLPTQAGQAAVLENGGVQGSASQPSISNSRLTISGAGWSLSAQAPKLRSNSVFGVDPGVSVTVQGSGYAPGTTVYGWFLSPSEFLNSTIVDPSGAFQFDVAIPDSAAAGTHVLQVNGFNTAGSVRSASIGLTVFTKATSPARVTIGFPAGKKRLDASARASIRDLLATLPKNAKTKTIVTAAIPISEGKAPSGTIAEKRANKIVAFLKKSGIQGSIQIKTMMASTKSEGNQVWVVIDFS